MACYVRAHARVHPMLLLKVHSMELDLLALHPLIANADYEDVPKPTALVVLLNPALGIAPI